MVDVDYGGRGFWWTWILVDVDSGGRGFWWTWILVGVDSVECFTETFLL